MEFGYWNLRFVWNLFLGDWLFQKGGAMSTWQVIKQLFKGTNFTWRKFFVVMLILVATGAGFYYWKIQNKTEAAYKIASTVPTNYIENVNLNIDVTPAGKVTLENDDYSNTLKIFRDYDEIRLLVFDKPGVFISNFVVTLTLPQDVTKDQIEQTVFAVHGVGSYDAYLASPRVLVYTAQNISSEASYTIVAHFPKTVLRAPFSKQMDYVFSQISTRAYIGFAIILPLITMIIMFMMIIRRRQDQIFYLSNKITNHPPGNTPPAVVGVLTDGQVGPREIAATLIDLANRGYIYITCHKNGTYSFGKRKSLNLEQLPELPEYVRILLSKIFEPNKYMSTGEDVDMRIGRHVFSRKIAQVYLNIYNETMHLGFFVKNPAGVHLRWRYTGIFFFFLGLLGFLHTAFFAPDPKFPLFLWVGEFIASIVIVWLSGLMPIRSVTGTSALRQWLQFRHYLKMAEPAAGTSGLMDEYRIMLPYAIVFGVETEWTRRFMEETFIKPNWFESDDIVVTLDVFASILFPIIAYVGGSLDKSHEPTVE